MARLHRTRGEYSSTASPTQARPTSAAITEHREQARRWAQEERARWEPRDPNAPLPTYPDAVLDEHAHRAVVGDRARRVAARLLIQRLSWTNRRSPHATVSYWTGVSPTKLTAQREWPELADAWGEECGRLLARTGLLDGLALPYSAARMAAGMQVDLGPDLPKDVDLAPGLPKLKPDVPDGQDFIDRYVYDGRAWRALDGYAPAAREREAAKERITKRYARKPLHRQRLALIAPSLRQHALLHERSMEAELRTDVANAQWVALWSLPPGDLVRRRPNELHAAIARELEELIVGENPRRAAPCVSWDGGVREQGDGDVRTALDDASQRQLVEMLKAHGNPLDALIAAEDSRHKFEPWDALLRVAHTPLWSRRLELLRLALLPDQLGRCRTLAQAKRLVALQEGLGVGAIDKMFSHIRMRALA